MAKNILLDLTLPRKESLASIASYLTLTDFRSKFIHHLFFHLSNLQYIAILLWVQLHLSPTHTDETLSYYVETISGLIILSYFIEKGIEFWIYSFLLIFTWVYFAVLLITCIYCAIKVFRSSQGQRMPSKTFTHSIFQLHITVMFFLSNVILMAPWSPKNQSLYIAINIQADAALCIVNLVLVILNCIMGEVLASFCFSPFEGASVLSTRSPSFQLLEFNSKAILSLLLPFLQKDDQAIQIIVIVIILIFSMWTLWFLFQTIPYYHYLVMKASIVSSSVAVCLSVVNIVGIFYFRTLPQGDITTLTYLDLLLIPIFVKLGLAKLSRDIRFLIKTSPASLISETEALKKLFSMTLIKNSLRLAIHNDINFNTGEVYFLGILAEHSQTCHEEDCFCNIYLRNGSLAQCKNVKKLKGSLDKYIQQRMMNFLARAIEQIKDNNELRATLVNLILNYGNDKITMALTNVFSISDISSNIIVKIKKEILIQRIQRKLDKRFLHRYKGILDIKSFIKFHTYKISFIEMLLSSTKKFIDFWLYAKQPTFQMIHCLQKSNAMEEEADRIEAQWNLSIKQSPKFYNQMKDVYCFYLNIVRNTPYKANKISRKHVTDHHEMEHAPHQATHQITQDNAVRHDTLVISASMTKDKPGRIQYISENVEKIIGFSQDDLLGRNINVLMTPMLGSYHEVLINNHLQQGSLPGGKVGHKNISGYIKNKKGFVQPCSFYLTIFPYIQNDINYINILRVNRPENEFLILSKDGFVEGFSQDIGLILNLSNTKLTNITEICLNVFSQKSFSGKSARKTSKLFSDNQEDRDLSRNHNKRTTLDRKLVQNMFDFSQIEEEKESSSGELVWKNVTFVKQDQPDELENPYIHFDVIIKAKEMMGTTFYIMTLKKKFSRRRMRKIVEKCTLDACQEGTFEIPNELTSTDKDLMSPHQNSSPTSPQDKSPTLYFTKIDLLSPSLVPLSEGVLSPKRLQTDNSQVQCDTEQNLLRKGESLQRKGTIHAKKLDKIEDDNETEHDNHDLRKVKKTNNKEKKYAKDSDRDASSLATTTGWRSQLEETIYRVPPNSLTKYTNVMIKMIAFVCIALLVTFLVNTYKNMVFVRANVKILTISSLRIFRLVETKRGMEGVFMLKNGIYSDSRFQNYNLPPFRAILMGSIGDANNYLNKLNSKLRFSLNQTENDLHQEFYTHMVKLTVNDSMVNVTYKNTFDAATELIIRVDKIAASIPAALLRKDDEDLNFVRRNIFNELLITSEQTNELIVQDTHLKFEELIELSLCYMVFMAVIGVVFTGLFVWRQRQALNTRNQFIDLFLRINERQIAPTLNKAIRLESALIHFHLRHSNSFKSRDNNSTTAQSLIKISEKSKGALFQGSDIRRKNANMKGINLKPFIAVVLSLIIFLIFLVPFIHMFIWIVIQDQVVRSKINTMVEVNTAMYEIILLPVAFYDYVLNRGQTLLRNRPIGEEWEAVYKKRAQAQGFFLNLLISNDANGDECDPSILKAFKELVNGDLCEILPKQRIQAVCPLLANGLLRKGIQAVNSYYLFTLRSLKDEYDTSDRSIESIKIVLSHQELKDIELFLARWQYSAYEMLGNIFESCTLEAVDRMETTLKIYLIFYITACLMAAGLISYVLMRLLEEDKIAWKKMARKIPLEIIKSNKMLRNYLIKVSGGIHKVFSNN